METVETVGTKSIVDIIEPVIGATFTIPGITRGTFRALVDSDNSRPMACVDLEPSPRTGRMDNRCDICDLRMLLECGAIRCHSEQRADHKSVYIRFYPGEVIPKNWFQSFLYENPYRVDCFSQERADFTVNAVSDSVVQRVVANPLDYRAFPPKQEEPQPVSPPEIDDWPQRPPQQSLHNLMNSFFDT